LATKASRGKERQRDGKKGISDRGHNNRQTLSKKSSEKKGIRAKTARTQAHVAAVF